MTGYSIDEVSKMSGITTRSVRNYLRKYRQLFLLRRGAYNSLVFNDADVETLIKIRTLLREGLKGEDIVTRVQEERKNPTMHVSRSDAPTTVATTDQQQALTAFFGRTEALLVQLCEDNLRMRQRMDRLEGTVLSTLEASPARRSTPLLEGPPRRESHDEALNIELPHFLVAARDGALAMGRAVYYTLFKRPARGAVGYVEGPAPQRPSRPARRAEEESAAAGAATHEADSDESKAPAPRAS